MEDLGKSLHEGDTPITEVNGLPDAVKFVRIDGPIARQIAHYALHKYDLEFVLESLKQINLTSSDSVKTALWEIAIVKFIKCFSGSSARIQLDEKLVYRDRTGAMEAFDYFKNLRNKHVVHDENSYTQSIPAAALNDGKKDFKIEKIVAIGARGITLDQANYANLELLTLDALDWVRTKFDDLCVRMTSELEKESLETLNKLPAITLKTPGITEIDKRRNAIAGNFQLSDSARQPVVEVLRLFDVPIEEGDRAKWVRMCAPNFEAARAKVSQALSGTRWRVQHKPM